MNDDGQPSGQELSERWRWTELGQIAAFINGDRGRNYPSQSDRVIYGVPFINTGHIDPNGRLSRDRMDYITRERFEKLGSGKVKPGDIVYCLRGSTIGKIARNEFLEGAIASSLIIIRAKDAALQDFIYHYLASPIGQTLAKKFDNGSAQPNLSGQVLSKYPIPLPPRPALVSMCQLLGALDDKIELNRRINETLEALARAIFKDWFVDFGPTRAKAEGRTPYIAPEIWNLFPDALDDEDKPVGWNVEPVHNQAHWVNGAAYKNMHFTEEPDALPVIKIAELKAGVTKTTKFTNTALGEKFRISNGELLFSWSGNPDTSIDTFIWTGGDAWLNQHIFAVRQNGKRSPAFLFSMLKWLKPEFAEIARNKQTTGLGHVTKQDLQRLRICIGTPKMLSAFDVVAAPIFSRIYSNLMESRSLAQTRDLLLPKLMSGEIRLAEAGKELEAVA